MNKEILRLALPNIITNITVPLLAMADTAIAGHLPSGLYIGAIAACATIFNFLYWNFSFLRMGTSGFTAQSYGAKNEKESVYILLRALFTAVSSGLVLILLQSFIFQAAFYFFKTSPEIESLSAEYFFIYIWAAPFVLSMYAITGWFIGMQNAKAPMIISISANIANIILSLLFVFTFDMGIKGIALGSLLAQIFAFLFSVFICLKFYTPMRKYLSWDFLKNPFGFMDFFKVNRDIFLRSAGLISVTVFFTAVSAQQGDIYLAANNLLMQLFILFSYIMDGFAYAAEALSGKYLGAHNQNALISIIKRIFTWGFVLSLAFTLIYWGFTGGILGLLTDKTDIIEQALKYKYWALLIPLAGFSAFLWDGIFVGLTASRQMRDSMLVAVACFFILYFTLFPHIGNNALWLAFIVYLSMRGLMQSGFFVFIHRHLKADMKNN